MLNKHAVGKWNKRSTSIHWDHVQEQCLEEEWEERVTVELSHAS